MNHIEQKYKDIETRINFKNHI